MHGFSFHRAALSVSVLLLLATFSSCNDQYGDELYDDIQFEKFDKVLYNKTITLKSTMRDVIRQYEITDEMLAPYRKELELLERLNIKYEVHAVSYHTVTPQGTPTIASGVVYYPLTFKPKGVIEISPTNKSKDSCGSRVCEMAEIIPGMMGYICIVPDLIGCGTTENLPISYLQHDNTAVVSADLRKAAEEFVYSHYKHKIGGKSILFGYSLGGSGIMALAREYQINPSRGVTVEHVFAGGGAYEPQLVVEAQLAADRSDYAIIPNILWSMNFYDNLNLDFSKIFKGDLQENMDSWCNGYVPIAELTRCLGTKISGYVSREFLDNWKTAEEYEPLRKAMLAKTLPFEWIPDAKIHLFHSKEDYYVPTICGDRLYERLKKAGADVEYVKYDEDHVFSCLRMEVDFAKFLQELK